MDQFLLRTLNVSTDIQPLELCVVVPVLNERENIEPLIQKLSLVLNGIGWEAIFVDDGSADGTPELIENISRQTPHIRLIRRFNRRGLSSAVIEGGLATTAPVIAVIDGDLQHDETILPALYRAIAHSGHHLAIGTRYAGGGSTGNWSSMRKLVSSVATRLAEKVTKVKASDPMSGFFAISRPLLVNIAPNLSGIGYKILLDILSSSSTPVDFVEIPYTFRSRQAGESKLDSAVAAQYFELLLEKRIGRWVPVRFLKFATVGALGLGVHMTLLLACHSAGLSFVLSQTIAVISAMTFNFFLNNHFTYSDRRLAGWKMLTGLVSFYLICSLGAVANVGVGTALAARNEQWWLAGLSGAVVGSVWNYVMGTLFTWRKQ